MLSKKEKLTRLDFPKLKGHKFQKTPTNIGVFCIYKASPLFTNSKYSIIVSKKNFKTAVGRNKAKRIFYNNIKKVKFTENKTVVFYPNKVFTVENFLSAVALLK